MSYMLGQGVYQIIFYEYNCEQDFVWRISCSHESHLSCVQNFTNGQMPSYKRMMLSLHPLLGILSSEMFFGRITWRCNKILHYLLFPFCSSHRKFRVWGTNDFAHCFLGLSQSSTPVIILFVDHNKYWYSCFVLFHDRVRQNMCSGSCSAATALALRAAKNLRLGLKTSNKYSCIRFSLLQYDF